MLLALVFAFCYCLSFIIVLWSAVDDREQDPWRVFE